MMFHRPAALAIFSAILFAAAARSAPVYIPSNEQPPTLEREFRGVWIATVDNIDWPSKPGLPVQQQKDELIKILDRAAKMNLNAVVFQVRPVCDAFYDSKIEPWSAYITGTMGKAPEPYYDPLFFAIEEAHKRGLELHAWFNPYRAARLIVKPVFSANHISRTHPELVRKYGDLLWLDPGEKEVQDYSLRVVMDVVKRYDIDGVHFDDYFYPYKEQDGQKQDIDFPDWPSWRKYGEGHGLSRDDWRRENVNEFVRRVYEAIKAEKPWVKFGISPFGIWQPGNPPQIKGMSSYDRIYADSRKWLINGWVDYFSPQLYWAIDAHDQSFPVLLKWWLDQNVTHRNLWPGLNSGNVGGKWKADEIINQIRITRSRCGNQTGDILYSMKGLMRNSGNLAADLERGLFAQPALVPSSPWLENSRPAKPIMTLSADGALRWHPGDTNGVSLWLLQIKMGNEWRAQILPRTTGVTNLRGSPDVITVTAIDRCGIASPVAALKKSNGPSPSSHLLPLVPSPKRK